MLEVTLSCAKKGIPVLCALISSTHWNLVLLKVDRKIALSDTAGIARMLCIVFSLSLSSLTQGCSSHSGLVPHTPFSKGETEELVAKYMRETAVSEEEARDLVARERRYTEEDFRKPFPDLRASDKRRSMCSNSILGGASQLVFVSEPISENLVYVKRSDCRHSVDGLHCGDLVSRPEYFYKTTDVTFSIRGLLDPSIALSLMEAIELDAVSYTHLTLPTIYSV